MHDRPIMHARTTTTIDANGVELHVEQAGTGDDVICISGLADEGACWVDQVDGLGDRWRITTFDNRGVGRSAAPDGEYRIADFAADTAALMDALGIERAHVARLLDGRRDRPGARASRTPGGCAASS